MRERYIAEFNRKFTVPAREKGTAFRRTARTDLNWIFTVQTERVVAKDNTVTIARSQLAVGEEPLSQFAGRLHGDHS